MLYVACTVPVTSFSFQELEKNKVYIPALTGIGVIPCQINKEFRVTSQILTKLGVFVVPVVLITHANF